MRFYNYMLCDVTETRRNKNLPYSIRMYWTNFWQPTVHVEQNILEKNLIVVGSSHLYASFGTNLRPNWSFIRDTVSLWRMFKHWQIAGFEGNCRRFRNSSECLKTLCAANNRSIWTKNVPTVAQRRGLQTFIRFFFKNILLYMNGWLSKISVYTYVMPRTFYFDCICTTPPFHSW